jgi:hypothetical protein
MTILNALRAAPNETKINSMKVTDLKKPPRNYKDAFQAGRISVITGMAKEYNESWDEFLKSVKGVELLKLLKKCGINHPYNENILWWAFDAGAKTKNLNT